MIVMHPKNENLLKTVSMANSRRWGARGGSWEGAGSESRGRPRSIRWPTGSTALADLADGLGLPGGQHPPTARTASASAVHAYVRLCSHPIGQCGRGICIHRPRTTAWPYDPTRPCALRIKGGLAAILRHT